MLISIIIVNWNAGHQIMDCLQSIKFTKQDGLKDFEIIIIDNGSTDKSLEFVDQLNFPVHIIKNKLNLGFSVACNQGAKVSTGDYLLFLNPDTIFFDNSLSIPFNYMERKDNQNVGIVGIQLLDEFNQISKSCARFPSPSLLMAQILGVNYLPGFGHLNTHMSNWAHDKTETVDHVIGAFYLIRRPLFETLGGFDERFFVYLEDLDLSLRALQEGYRSVYLTEAQAFHAGGGTSNQVKARRLFYSLRSRLLYAFKHFTILGAIAVLLATLFVEPLTRSVLALLRRSWSGLTETWNAYGMLWCDIGAIFKSRRL